MNYQSQADSDAALVQLLLLIALIVAITAIAIMVVSEDQPCDNAPMVTATVEP